jgi:hypothetical protein
VPVRGRRRRRRAGMTGKVNRYDPILCYGFINGADG